jgi:hypothetical protein
MIMENKKWAALGDVGEEREMNTCYKFGFRKIGESFKICYLAM